MAGHSQVTYYRFKTRRVVEALEKANQAAKELPYGWDSEIPNLQRAVNAALQEALRMNRNANGMVAAENKRLQDEAHARKGQP